MFSISDDEEDDGKGKKHIITVDFCPNVRRYYVIKKYNAGNIPLPQKEGDWFYVIKGKKGNNVEMAQNTTYVSNGNTPDGSIVVKWPFKRDVIGNDMLQVINDSKGSKIQAIQDLISFYYQKTGTNTDKLDELDCIFILRTQTDINTTRVIVDDLCTKYLPDEIQKKYSMAFFNPVYMVKADESEAIKMRLTKEEENKLIQDDEDENKRSTLSGYIWGCGMKFYYGVRCITDGIDTIFRFCSCGYVCCCCCCCR